MSLDFEKLQQGKLYDFVLGLPLIGWFGYVGVVRARPNLSVAARYLLANPASLYANLHFCALLVSIIFNILTVYLVIARTPPVRRTRGYWGRLFGVIGTFLGVGIQYLPTVQLPLAWLVLSTILMLVGTLGSLIALSRLGKSFSIMPEARQLVTGGPYSLARHPLYATELITVFGMAILFQQPWAALLAIAVGSLLVVRSFFEEQVLSEQFPEYAEYRKRVKRFGFV